MADFRNTGRDTRQRTFGAISFSLLAHAGFLGLVLFAPQAILTVDTSDSSSPLGTESGTTYMELTTSGPAEAAPQPKASEPMVTTEPQSVPLAVKAEAQPAPPIVVPIAEPVKPRPAKATQATQATSVAKPSAPEVLTEDHSDIAISEALAQARAERSSSRLESVVEAEAETDEQEQPIQVKPAPPPPPKQLPRAVEAKPKEAPPAKIISAPKHDEPAEDEPAGQEEAASVAEEDETPVAASTDTEEDDAGEASEDAKPAAAVAAAPAQSASGAGQGTSVAGGASRGAGTSQPAGIPAGAKIREEGLRAPAPGNRDPVYPQQDRLSRREGTAVVIAKVLADGTVAEVHLKQSSGSKLMDQSAMQAYKSWKYRPGQEEYLQKAFVFKLTGEAVPMTRQLGKQ